MLDSKVLEKGITPVVVLVRPSRPWLKQYCIEAEVLEVVKLDYDYIKGRSGSLRVQVDREVSNVERIDDQITNWFAALQPVKLPAQLGRVWQNQRNSLWCSRQYAT